MIEEPLTDEERRILLGLIYAAIPAINQPGTEHPLIGILRKISGCDTALVARRAYPSRSRACAVDREHQGGDQAGPD
jgi:hypothetical protein